MGDLKKQALNYIRRLEEYISEGTDIIKRLVEELDKQTYKADLLENRLKVLVGTKPLSDEEIIQIYSQIDGRGIINLVRAVEERFGIK